MNFGANHRLVTTLILLFVTALAMFGALRLKIDTSYDKLISDHDPGWAVYAETVKTFGSDNVSIIYMRDKNMFTPERLALVDRLVTDLKKDPAIQRVDSIYSALSIRDVDGSLESQPVAIDPPVDQEEADLIKQRALYSPLVKKLLVSEDGQSLSVAVSLTKPTADREANTIIYQSIEDKLVPLRQHFDTVYQIGPPRLNVEIEHGMLRDLSLFMPLSTLILVGTVLYFLRTWHASVVPLITAGLSILWTFGFMGWTSIPLSLLTTLVPALNIVIGSAEDTHMMSAYLRAISDQREKGMVIDRRAAIRFMTSHLSLAILLTSSTTVIGFLSDALYDVPIMIEFAFAASFALTANFFATVLTMPLLLSLIGPKKSTLPPLDEAPGGLMGRFVAWLEYVGLQHRKLVIVIFTLITAGFGYAAKDITVSNDPLSYFRDSSQLVQDAKKLHTDLAGMQVFYLTLTAKDGRDFRDPDMLRQAEAIEKELKGIGVFDSVLSLPDFMSLVNREMHQANPAYAVMPESRGLVDQYLLLFSRQDLDRYVTADYSKVNIVVRHNISDSSTFNGYIDKLEKNITTLSGATMTHEFIGKNLMVNRTAEGMIYNQADSLMWVVVVILVLMALLYQSLLAGIISMVPNLIPIAICFGTMALVGLPLNPGTASVAAVALGIAVDDTIHFFSAYLLACKHEPDPDTAIRTTFYSEVVPVITTTVALSSGFVILAFSDFTIVAQYGLMSAFTIFIAMFVDLFMTPAILRGVRLVGLWDVVALKIGNKTLLNSPLFRGMGRFQVKKAILTSALRTYQPGETLVTQGETGRDMFVILSGEAEVVQKNANGEQVLARLNQGDVAGEVGFVGQSKRTATVRATEPVEAMVMEAANVQRSLRFYPWVAHRLQQNISRILADRLTSDYAGNKAPAKAETV
ncbi:MAG: MMPL family transporter [Bacteroidales bacterium]